MDELLKYHAILRKMEPAEKIAIIRGLMKGGTANRQNMEILYEILGDDNYDFRRAAYEELKVFGAEIMSDVLRLLKEGNSDQKYWAVQLLVSMGAEGVTGLEVALSEDDETIRRIAIKTLGSLQAKSSVKPLMTIFSRPQWSLRQEAFEALLNYGSSIFQECLKRLDSDDEDQVYWSVRLLGSMGQRSRKVLMDALQKRGPELKFVIASALGETGDEKILEMLAKMLKDDSVLHCRRASDALVRIGNPAVNAVAAELEKAAPNKAYWHIKTMIGLGDDGLRRMADILIGKKEVWLWDARDILNRLGLSLLPCIRIMLEAKKQNVRFFAYQLLADLGENSHIPLLIDGLRDNFWPSRKLCADTLVKMGAGVVAYLKPLLNSADQDQNYWFLSILKNTEQGRELLMECLRSENRQTASMAARFLRGLVTPACVSPLIDCLRSRHWPVRREAADTLIAAGVVGVEKVIATLAIEDSELRYWLSGILKSWPKSVYPHICALFYQDKYPVHLAAYAAGIIKEPYFVPALREILKEQDNLLVLYATWALSEILPGEEIRAIWGMLSKLDAREHVVFSEVVRKYKNSAPAYLLSGLKSAEKQLVLNSCYFCGLLELTEAVPVLEELLSNRDEGVCLAAAEAFLKLDYRAIIPKLRSVLTRDLSSDFRLKILSILGVFGEDDVVPVILKMMCTAANEAERDIYSREIFRMGIGVVPRLIKHLAHEEPILRKVAAELLLEFGSLAVPELKKELVGRDPNRKYWAAKILKTEGR